MQDFHKDIVAFHDEKVTLPDSERTDMRKRRDANRQRVRQALSASGKPLPKQFQSQGSYSMRTMVQQVHKDYDIDDGVFFIKEQLDGPRGGSMRAVDAKKMIRDAVDDRRFTDSPEVRMNCVRVLYRAGYHVDLPVYRIVIVHGPWGDLQARCELASSDWKVSDPQSVTKWFLDANKARSPDTRNGGQMRRVVRLLKAFARSRPTWHPRIASGFVITKLVVESYQAFPDRDDLALMNTIKQIASRLQQNLEIQHPTVPNEMLTTGARDARASFLAEKLLWAIQLLKPSLQGNFSREETLKQWDKVFRTTFFSTRFEKITSKRTVSVGSAGLGIRSRHAARTAVDRRGGGRYA